MPFSNCTLLHKESIHSFPQKMKEYFLNKSNCIVIVALGLITVTLPLGQGLADQFEEAKLNSWHHWRGPDANGVSITAKPPVQWSPTNNIQWKVPIEGNGSSTPIIWGNKLFVLTALNPGVEVRAERELVKTATLWNCPASWKIPAAGATVLSSYLTISVVLLL